MSEKVEKTVLEQIEAVKDSPEFKTLITNSNTAYWDGKIGAEVSKLHGYYDTVLKETLGIEKDPNIKSTEQIKAALQKYKGLEAKLKDLEGKETPDNSEQLKLLEAKISGLEALGLEKDTKLGEEKEKNLQGKISSKIDAALAGKTYKPSYSDEDLKELIGLRKSRLLKRSKVVVSEDGTERVVFYKDAEKTKPYLNTVNDPMTSKEVAELEFGTLFVEKKKGGNSSTTETGEVAEGEAITMNMSKINTREKFFLAVDKALQAKGIATTHKDYKTIKAATYKAYKANELPMS